MLGTLIIAFCIGAFLLLMLFLCICGASFLGIFGLVSPFIVKVLARSHDQPYSEDSQPINNECFICL